MLGLGLLGSRGFGTQRGSFRVRAKVLGLPMRVGLGRLGC